MNRRYALDFTMALPLCAILFCIPFVCASLPGLNNTHILTLDASDSPSCNTRTLWDIVSGCVSTLFACTWTAIHLDFPRKDEGMVYATCLRLLLMFTAFLAPEFVVAWAMWQFLNARRVAKDFNREFRLQRAQHRSCCRAIWRELLNMLCGGSTNSDDGWTKTHGFFAWMGGFVLYVDGQPRGTLTPDKLQQFVRDKLVEMPVITEAQIKNRSKGDILSKCVAIVQLLWFISQIIVRYAKKLPVTLLEIDTLGVAVLTCISSALWLNKPKDARLPYIVHWKGLTEPPSADSLDNDKGHGISSTLERLHNFVIPRPDMATPRGLTIDIGCISGMLFGAIHCLGWNFLFPGYREQRLWRAAAVGIPYLLGAVVEARWLLAFLRGWRQSTLPVSGEILKIGRIGVLSGLIAMYIVPRALIIVLMFLSLRSLPPGAYDTVAWTKFIPHVNL